LPRKWRLTWSGLRLIRGRRYNRLKKKITNPEGIGGKSGKIDGGQIVHHQKTADTLAEEYGVSSKTIQRDAKFAEEVEANLEWAKADPGTEIQPTEKGRGGRSR